MKIVRSEVPGIAFIPSESRPGMYYRISHFGSAWPECSCPSPRECKHVIAALEAASNKEKPEMADEEMTTAVAIAGKTAQVVRAEAQRMTVVAQHAGWNDLKAMGADLIKTGFAPKDVDTPEKAAMILLKAVELDIPVTAAFNFIYIIGGRPAIMSQMLGALVRRSGKGHIHIEESDAEKCVAVGMRYGQKPVRITFTIKDAAKANLLKNPTWIAYPADQLRAKAIARVARVVFPDVINGVEGTPVASRDAIVDDDEFGQLGTAEVIEGEYTVPDHIAGSGKKVTDAWQASDEPADEGEYTELPLDEPAEVQRPPWATQELSKLLSAAALSMSDLRMALGVPVVNRENFEDLINCYLDAAPGRSLATLITDTQAAISAATSTTAQEALV